MTRCNTAQRHFGYADLSGGPPGPRGEKGDAGVQGADGRTIEFGNGPPTALIGNPSDFYIDLLTYDWYGPKIGSTWGTPTNLRATVTPVTVTVPVAHTLPALPAHGFHSVRATAGGPVVARAVATELPHAFAVDVSNPLELQIQTSGALLVTGHGLTVGETYYLDGAGGLTVTPPSPIRLEVVTAFTDDVLILHDSQAVSV